MTTPQPASSPDVINPLVPEDFEQAAQVLNLEHGIPVDKLTVRLYRKQPAPKLKAFIVTYRYREFNIENVQAVYGAGEYLGELWTESNHHRGCRCRYEFECAGPAIRQPEPAPAQQHQQVTFRANEPQAAPSQGTPGLLELLIKQQGDMMIALAGKQTPAPDRWWIPLVAPLLPDVAKKLMGGGAGQAMGLGQVREFLDFIEDRKGERDEGSPLMGLIEKCLPAFLQQQGANQAAATAGPAAQTSARSALPPTPAQPARALTAEQPASTGPVPTDVGQQEPKEKSAPSADGASAEAKENAALSLEDFLGGAIAVVRTACACQQPDIGSYANILADMIDANNVDTSIVAAAPLGTVADLLISQAQDLRMYRPFLVQLETELRTLYADEESEDVPGQTIIEGTAPLPETKKGTVASVGISTPQTPPTTEPPAKSPQQRAAETRAANKAAALAAASKEAQK